MSKEVDDVFDTCAFCGRNVPMHIPCQCIKFEKDDVNHPSHYNQGKIEVIEFIEDQKLGFHKGNAVKYVCRAGKKDPSKYVQDLEKAIWYLQREIEIQKANPCRPNEMVKK